MIFTVSTSSSVEVASIDSTIAPNITPLASAQWIPICLVQDIPALGARRVARAAGLPVAVFRAEGDQIFALLDRCPHKAGPLSQGIVHGVLVACPLHNWNIQLDSGQAVEPDEGCTPRFACKVEAGRVFLDSQELAAKALDLAAPVAGPRPCAGAGEQRIV